MTSTSLCFFKQNFYCKPLKLKIHSIFFPLCATQKNQEKGKSQMDEEFHAVINDGEIDTILAILDGGDECSRESASFCSNKGRMVCSDCWDDDVNESGVRGDFQKCRAIDLEDEDTDESEDDDEY
jgi:hypothetical protein